MAKILVVEDEIAILENVGELLELQGYEVLSATNGLDAIRHANYDQPDLVICDISMPVMDGFGVLMEMKSNPTTNRTPFVFLTALTDRDTMRKGMEHGADDFLTKPFSSKELLAMVRTQLDKKNLNDETIEQEISSIRNNIISMLPHELRTPLTGIVSCAEILMMDFEMGVFDQERIPQMVSIIQRAGKRLERLTENYLVYAQIELFYRDAESQKRLLSGEGIIAPESILGVSIYQISNIHNRSQDIINHIQPLPTSLLLKVSEVNLNKIVSEILDNACKFSAMGSHIQLKAGLVGDRYTIQILDQGRGMTEEQIQRIGAYMQFNRQIHEQQGSGLVLIIAMRLAQLHGGDLLVESKINQGTMMTITLPLM